MRAALKEQIQTQMTTAMKAGDKVALGRAPHAVGRDHEPREVEVRHELSDDEVREVAGKEVKKRAESIEAFDAAGRTELADKERAEREVLAAYAPDAARPRRRRRADRRGARRDGRESDPRRWAR